MRPWIEPGVQHIGERAPAAWLVLNFVDDVDGDRLASVLPPGAERVVGDRSTGQGGFVFRWSSLQTYESERADIVDRAESVDLLDVRSCPGP